MKKLSCGFSIVLSGILLAGCGYSTSSALPPGLSSIYVAPFRNRIDYGREDAHNIYLPLLEVKVRNAVIDRFLFDGNLKIRDKNQADMVLRGELLRYVREPLRYTDNDDVQEYRVLITVNLILTDADSEEVLWEEPAFIGEAEYFVSGPQAGTEAAAVENATVDLARRVVERTIENW